MKQNEIKNQESTDRLTRKEEVFVEGLARILIEQAKREIKKQKDENSNLRKEEKML